MNKLLSIFLLLYSCCVVTLGDENYPYRSDYLWVTVPNHTDWIYKFDVGLQRQHLSAHPSYAVWNLLQCEKECLITPINEHWTSDATDRWQLDWLLSNLK